MIAMKNKTVFIARCAVLAALACVLTIFPKVPIGEGYVHFGDCVIYAAALVMGPIAGAAVGAVGHSLADLISGFPIYCIPTLVIKGILGFTIGKILHEKQSVKRYILAAAASLVIVTGGYFIAEFPIFGMAQALVSLVSSPIQWAMSMVASAVIIPVLIKNRNRLNF